MAAALVLLTVSAAPAPAGFRYVPPAETEAEPAKTLGPQKGSGAAGAARGTPAAPGADVLHEDIEPPAGPGPGGSGLRVSGTSVSGTSVSGTSVSGASVWRVHAGEMLREVLARWGARAGTDVVFLTDRRYRLEGAASFGGGFGQAAQTLFAALAHLPHPPEGALSADGRSIAVTHRAPAANHGRTVP